MKTRILVAAVLSTALTTAPAFLRALLVLPWSGGVTVGVIAWKCFVALTYPPLYLSERIGWYDGFKGDVLKGVHVFQPPSLWTMLWTHSVVAFPFWFVMALGLALVLRWAAAALIWVRARAAASG